MAPMKIEPPDRLADDHVTIRPMRSEDAGPYAAAFDDDTDLGRLLGVEHDPDEQTVRQRVEGQAQRAEDGMAVELAIADPATDAFWGSVILHSFCLAEPPSRGRILGHPIRPRPRRWLTCCDARGVMGAWAVWTLRA
jgi:hypothetical protein